MTLLDATALALAVMEMNDGYSSSVATMMQKKKVHVDHDHRRLAQEFVSAWGETGMEVVDESDYPDIALSVHEYAKQVHTAT